MLTFIMQAAIWQEGNKKNFDRKSFGRNGHSKSGYLAAVEPDQLQLSAQIRDLPDVLSKVSVAQVGGRSSREIILKTFPSFTTYIEHFARCYIPTPSVMFYRVPTRMIRLGDFSMYYLTIAYMAQLNGSPGFESRQGASFLGIYTLQCCCHNLICIVIVCTWEKINA
jgi:hypothetical protein